MEAALACVRFAHFAALMVLFGSGVYLWLFSPPALSAALAPKLRLGWILAAGLAMVSAIVWLALEAASMTEDGSAALDPGAVTDILVSTAFGAVWIWRLPLLLALFVAVLFVPPRWPALGAMLAAAALASLALVDHGSMQTGPTGIEHRLNDALHLVLTGGWLGALPPFALSAALLRRAELARDVETAMSRFSLIGHFAVFGILATGAINIALTSGHAPWPPETPYRQWLILKLVVVAVMIALATFNRYVLLPSVDARPGRRGALAALSLVEFALALIAVALVSEFGLRDPA